MKHGLLVTVALELLLLPATGCLLSLQPLYTDLDKHIVLEPALLGVWMASGSDGAMVALVKETDQKSYDITVVGMGKSETDTETDSEDNSELLLRYRGRLVRLGDYLFLDLVAHEDAAGAGEFVGLLRTHMFFRVQLRGDVLQVQQVNEKLIEDPDERWLRHESSFELFGPTVLTAPPSQIRERLEKHSGDSGIYEEPMEFRRVK